MPIASGDDMLMTLRGADPAVNMPVDGGMSLRVVTSTMAFSKPESFCDQHAEVGM